jgi:hypothetical protein
MIVVVNETSSVDKTIFLHKISRLPKFESAGKNLYGSGIEREQKFPVGSKRPVLHISSCGYA